MKKKTNKPLTTLDYGSEDKSKPKEFKIIKTYDVDSSNILAIGYDEPTKTLQIDFVSGGSYQYNPIPLPYWKAFQIADSKGSFFTNHIKNKPTFQVNKIS